ncbi:MAG: site-2 protease family protein [Bacteroidia bacterium]|nr:site-2 protease family protein [Bacteroidia bacterium]
MKGALKIGRVAGIKIEVHWTFTLILLWVVFLDIQRGGNLASSLMNITLILFLFVCVVLHELGHALTAKRMNIKTKQITLLPIGGVASLEKMPEKPSEELLVALAGPAVNVVLAMLLYLVVPIQTYISLDAANLENLLSAPSLQTLLFYLFIANVMLVLFNMIPAFPMDGGRVLRAILSYRMDRVKATDIAASIGQVFAVIFFVLGLLYNPFLVLIALFIFIGAYGENQMVKQTSMIEGYLIESAMLTKITILKPEDTIDQVIVLILAGTEKDFIVVDQEKIVGILYQKDIIGHVKFGSMKIKEIMKQKFRTIDKKEELKKFFEMVNKEGQRFIPVTGDDGVLEGAIDMHNVSEFLLIRSQLIN